ncbi:hypothetical protein AC579_4437 [Pseudocercospora musae]|uniref:Uncharacterized protein n=1 Tax=Pseudocercospora musae TaxID=113226 RepID=A0A139I443_9PEZI|nr:hypothetical protein AC579_4437 [Pseudocercospora musae]
MADLVSQAPVQRPLRPITTLLSARVYTALQGRRTASHHGSHSKDKRQLSPSVRFASSHCRQAHQTRPALGRQEQTSSDIRRSMTSRSCSVQCAVFCHVIDGLANKPRTRSRSPSSAQPSQIGFPLSVGLAHTFCSVPWNGLNSKAAADSGGMRNLKHSAERTTSQN